MAWYDPAWTKRVPVTVVAIGVTGTPGHFDILLTESNFPVEFWAGVKADGSDIVATDTDEITKLNRDLITIDTAGQTMLLRVGIPTGVTDLADKIIYIYYGNAAGAEGNSPATYRPSLLHYWPLQESVAGNNFIDRAGNSNLDVGTLVDPGNVGSSPWGQSLQGGPDQTFYIETAANGSTDGLSEFSLLVNIFTNPGNANSSAGIASHGPRIGDRWTYYMDGNNRIYGRIINFQGGNYRQINGGYDSRWVQGGIRFDGSQATDILRGRLIEDGLAVTMVTPVVPVVLPTNGRPVRLLSNESPTSAEFWEGMIAHPRIFSEALPDDYIATVYDNEYNIGTFYTVGAEEIGGGGPTGIKSASGFANMDKGFTNMRG